ncbi:MAG: glycosyltransferase [Planctomycetota bacterium]|nr:glycosyltransferase [Planctomycetota bacterium]
MDAKPRQAFNARNATSQVPAPLVGLRVALVHDWLTGLRGGEKCLEVLCRAFPGATLHTLIHKKGSVGPTIGAMMIRTSPLQRLPGVERHYRKLLPIMPAAARFWNVGEVDLVVSLSHCVAKAVRVPKGVPHVCYCFTPMRYAWDGRAAYLESWTGRPVRRAAAGFMLDRLRAWDKATSSSVSHFVAISETVRGRIDRCYGRDGRVIEPPVDTSFYSPAPVDRDGPYLCVSALVPYKRIDQAIQVCSSTGRPLVVIGAGPDRDRLQRLAGPGVTFLGWQTDESIRDHYRRCRALLFPGEEDFGIVPAEAMACGAPVIALARGGAAETVDERAGVLYQEPTADGLRDAIESWEHRGRPHDPAWARQRAEVYALPRFRERLLNYLADVVGGSAAHKAPPAPHVLSGSLAPRGRGDQKAR